MEKVEEAEVNMELIAAAAALLTGIWFGQYQLSRWELAGKKRLVGLAAAAGIIFLAGYYVMNLYGYHILKMVRYWILMYGLLLLAFLDGKRRIIPNRALFLLAGIRTLLLVGECICFPEVFLELVLSSAAGFFGGGALFLLASLLAGKGLGMGDVKLIAVMGYYLGFQVLMSSLIIIMTLTVFVGAGALLLKKATLKTEIPFAPFAAAGTIITILMGF